MSDRMSLVLYNAQQGNEAINQAWQWAKPRLIAGQRLSLDLRMANRSVEQNARLHALIGEIAGRVEWAGKMRDTETWKRLLTAAWLRGRGEPIEMLPALDGHGVDIVFRRTSELTVAECGELMDFIEAWAAVEVTA